MLGISDTGLEIQRTQNRCNLGDIWKFFRELQNNTDKTGAFYSPSLN